MAPVLGYWNVRGFAEPIRYLLAYAGEEYEDKRYVLGPDGDKSAWLDEKYSHGFDFPNLPYYIDDNVKVTQSLAILRYLGRKYDLVDESTEEARVQTDVVEQQLADIRFGLYMLVLKPDYRDLKEEYATKLEAQYKMLSDFLGDKEWIIGKLTYVDFLAYETLAWHRYFLPNFLDDFPRLKEYMTRFEELPAIEEYFKSPNYKEFPLFGPKCYWGGQEQLPED